MNSLKSYFLLKPGIVFLNHGSFGATPKPVFREYQKWQRILEKQPVEFFVNNFLDYITHARNKLAEYVHCDPQNLFFIPNSTFGVNMVSRGVNLSSGDEIIITNHEYGACSLTWQYICNKYQANVKCVKIPVPIPTTEEIIKNLLKEINSHTKLVFISHISSPTSIIFPVQSICNKLKEKNIPIFIDGAHAPGQISIDLNEMDPDYYVGNCHKWMMAPKGSAFLYINPRVKKNLHPLVVSWGYEKIGKEALDLTEIFQWIGTDDPSAYLSVPSAIKFQDENHWDLVQSRCHQLAQYTYKTLEQVTGLPCIYSNDTQYAQMITSPLPPMNNLNDAKRFFYKKFKIEVPFLEWENQPYIRVSIQGYNDQSDIDSLEEALKQVL